MYWVHPSVSGRIVSAWLLTVKVFAVLSLAMLAGKIEASDLPSGVTTEIQLEKAKRPRLRVSCGHPKRSSYRKRRGVMSFTLEHGDIGRCYTDKPAYFPSGPVPFMERAELYSDFRDVGPRYRFSALVHMGPASETAPDTTVFQVHQWVQESCRCEPPVMLGFDGGGQLKAWGLSAPNTHVEIPLKGWGREDFETKWVEIAVDVTSAYGKQNVTVWLGGHKVLSRNALIQNGGALFLKVGLYRPGSRKARLPTDRLHVRDVQIGVLH